MKIVFIRNLIPNTADYCIVKNLSCKEWGPSRGVIRVDSYSYVAAGKPGACGSDAKRSAASTSGRISRAERVSMRQHLLERWAFLLNQLIFRIKKWTDCIFAGKRRSRLCGNGLQPMERFTFAARILFH